MRTPTVAIAALLVALLSLGLMVNLIVTPIRSSDAEIEALHQQLDTLDERLVSAEAALEASKSVLLPEGVVRTGGDQRLAESELQELVRAQLVDADAVTLTSQIVSTKLSSLYGKTSVLVHAQIAEASLMSFLQQLRQVRPVVLVEGLDISPLPFVGDARFLDVTATLSVVHLDAAS